MASYLTSNMKFAAKNVGFTTSKEQLIENDEELGRYKNITSISSGSAESNKEEQNSFPHHKIIYGVLFTCMIRFLIMLMYSVSTTTANFHPHEYLVPCNASNLMSIDNLDILLQNISQIHEEIKSISIVNEYHLNYNATAFLNQKHRNYTASLINYEAEYEYQKEKYYTCYKDNIRKDMDTAQHTVFGSIILMAPSYMLIFGLLLKAKMSTADKKQSNSIAAIFGCSLIIFVMDVMIAYSFFDEYYFNKKLAKFPM